MSTTAIQTVELLKEKKTDLFEAWLDAQYTSELMHHKPFNKDELHRQSEQFLEAFLNALGSDALERPDSPEYRHIEQVLQEISRTHALQGVTPTETANYIFSLRESLYKFMQVYYKNKPKVFLREINAVNRIIDRLGLLTFENYTRGREEVITRQQREVLELSVPVIQVWEGVLCLPLIGTLDSERSHVVMENLLQEIVKTASRVAILDISGVPAVDTLVAQHLIKTVNAAQLMGAECIISGIRPEIAQTIVQLGIDLSSVRTKATMAQALKAALNLVEPSATIPSKTI